MTAALALPPPPADDPRGRKLWGWKDISAHLGCSERTARAWEQLLEDPLPTWRFRGQVWAWSGYLTEWLERRAGRGERVEGWEAICARLEGITPTTARAWAREPVDRLPVYGVGERRPWAWAGALRDRYHRAVESGQAAIARGGSVMAQSGKISPTVARARGTSAGLNGTRIVASL